MIYFEATALRGAEGGGTWGAEAKAEEEEEEVVVVVEEEMLRDSRRRVPEALIAGPWED